MTEKNGTNQIKVMVAEHARIIMRDADLVAHFDDDQLAILCPATRCEEALIPAMRLRERVAQTRSLSAGQGSMQVTVSIGLTAAIRGDNVATILNRADEALVGRGARRGQSRRDVDQRRARHLVEQRDRRGRRRFRSDCRSCRPPMLPTSSSHRTDAPPRLHGRFRQSDRPTLPRRLAGHYSFTFSAAIQSRRRTAR